MSIRNIHSALYSCALYLNGTPFCFSGRASFIGDNYCVLTTYLLTLMYGVRYKT